MESERAKLGQVIADFAGMVTDSDPRDLARGEFQILENVSLESRGRAKSRRGMRNRHVAPFTANLTATKRTHTIFSVGLRKWLVSDVGDGSFRAIYADSSATTNYTLTPSPAWHSEPKMCFAKTSGDELIIANGIDRPWKYNGMPGTTVNGEGPACALGIDPPLVAPSATHPGSGNATAGTYYVAYRWLDRFGNPSILSPITTLTGVAASDKFEYSAIANSSGKDSTPRITQKQIFRSLVNDPSVLYLVTTIADNSTTTYTTDTYSDVSLSEQAELPILDAGLLVANRFVVPPSHKKVVLWHEDRLWFMADGSYSTGTIETVASDATIVGTGTNFTDEMIGWEIWPNATGYLPYKITAINSGTSVEVAPTPDANAAGLTYVARPARSERNVIYASEPEEPEAVPQSQNSVLVQISGKDDNDEIVGGFTLAQGLFAVKKRHIYRIDYVRQGKLSASAVPVAARGAFSHRSIDTLDAIAWAMDRYGMYEFAGNGEQPIGGVFQNYWREGLIDFSKADEFFVAVNRNTQTVRFYVVLVADASTYPKFCFCYNYALKRWSTETRPWEVTGAGAFEESGEDVYYELPYGGYPAVYDDGYAMDGVIAAVRGTVSAYNSGTGALTATANIFTNAMVGAPVVVTSGSGKRQLGVITAYTDANDVVVSAGFHASATPAAGDTFVIGGVPWRMKSAMFDLPATGGERNGAMLDVYFTPTSADSNSLDLRHYLNHRTTPENAAADQAEQADMAASVSGSPDSTVSMYASKNSLGEAVGIGRKNLSNAVLNSLGSDRHLTVEVRGIAAEERHTINQIDIGGVR